MKGQTLDAIERTLLAPRSIDRGLFRPEALKQLFREHRSGRRDNSLRIWRLLTLEIWFQTCIEGDELTRVLHQQVPTMGWDEG